ncbi:MAG: phenylalanine--tRNA ligase subunit beta [Tenericutes bacterium]|nr:phenylalanine--tRNA ligase subunit beta [Mycoplasmatota bacterium]
MKVSINWLKEYVNIDDNYKILEDSFNLMSQEVESLYKLVDASHLVVGHVLTCEKHPQADKLNITTVNIGEEETLQIICGAPNVAAGQKVIVALVGAVLPGDFKIKKAKIRGIESVGMICSLDELGMKEFDPEEKGIYVLDSEALPGSDPLACLYLDDYVLDLDLTANRPDLLSMEGVAYDVACMLNKDITLKTHDYDYVKKENNLKVFTDTNKCSAYYGQIIRNVTVKESPAWLKSRLLAAGIRPISNVVDITNYVLIEYGQPLHAFDYDKLGSDTIIVRTAEENEVLVTLDDQERKLEKDDVVITNGKKAVALAGVMGGLETEVDSNTKTILLESAIFDPVSVRKTSKRLDLKSEASTRFEKGLDPNKVRKAMDYATELFVKLADGEVYGKPSYFDNTDKSSTEIILTLEKLNQVSGYEFQISQVEEILDRLRFDYKSNNKQFVIKVPTRRQNVYGYQDIIEEIVRIFGYDLIPATIPCTPTSGYLTKKQKLRRKVREYFVNLGFDETITYSLVTDEEVTQFDKEELSQVTIMNPINIARKTLRHSILPSLISVLQYNKKRKTNDLCLFELGRQYTEESETELLSGLMYGVYSASQWQGIKQTTDFYLVKGILEELLEILKITDYEIVKTTHKIDSMHPGIHADLLIKGEYIGFLGKLHPEVEHKNSINKTFVFELSFDKLVEYNDTEIEMTEIPRFPSVQRDLAIIIDKDIPVSELVAEVRKAGKKQLKTIDIFDLYLGENLGENKKSVALSLEFRSNEKTLETQEVDVAINRILKQLETTLNANLR